MRSILAEFVHDDPDCRACLGTGCVCAAHPGRAWGPEAGDAPTACRCDEDGGAPCPLRPCVGCGGQPGEWRACPMCGEPRY